MKIFRGKKVKGEGIRPRLIRTVNTSYQRTQMGWVQLMESSTKNFSKRSWIITLIIYAIASIGVCSYLIISSIR